MKKEVDDFKKQRIVINLQLLLTCNNRQHLPFSLLNS